MVCLSSRYRGLSDIQVRVCKSQSFCKHCDKRVRVMTISMGLRPCMEAELPITVWHWPGLGYADNLRRLCQCSVFCPCTGCMFFRTGTRPKYRIGYTGIYDGCRSGSRSDGSLVYLYRISDLHNSCLNGCTGSDRTFFLPLMMIPVPAIGIGGITSGLYNSRQKKGAV